MPPLGGNGAQSRGRDPVVISDWALPVVSPTEDLSVEIAQAAIVQVIGEPREDYLFRLWTQEQNDVSVGNYRPTLERVANTVVVGSPGDLRPDVPLLLLQVRCVPDRAVRISGPWCSVSATGTFGHLTIENAHGRALAVDTRGDIEIDSSDPGVVACAPISGSLQVRCSGASFLWLRSAAYDGGVQIASDGDITAWLPTTFDNSLDLISTLADGISVDPAFAPQAMRRPQGAQRDSGAAAGVRLLSHSGRIRVRESSPSSMPPVDVIWP